MGKKSRTKVQKQKQTAAATPKSAKLVKHNTALIEKLAGQGDKPGKAAPKAAVSSDDYAYVVSDVKRTLLLITISVIVLVAAVIVNSRTNWLITLGEKLTSLLGLGA